LNPKDQLESMRTFNLLNSFGVPTSKEGCAWETTP